MIKFALYSINFLGLFFIGLFSEDEILVENNTPAFLRPGEKKEVQITINKSNTQGFAMLQLTLPNGLIATAGDTKGASFTFSQQKARFVWMAMPNESSFTVTYYLESLDGVTGTFNVNGAFSYILENKRVDYTIPVKSVAVNKGEVNATEAVAASTPTPTNDITGQTAASTSTTSSTTPSTTTSAASTTASVAEPVAEVKTTKSSEVPVEASEPAITASASEPKASSPDMGGMSSPIVTAMCSRTITALSDTEFQVDIKISNNDIRGFAKILETVPDNCKTLKIQDAGAVVTQDRNTIKFVWFEIPNSPTVDISYKIECLTAVNGIPTINGVLNYVENNNPRELRILDSGASQQEITENKPKEVIKNGSSNQNSSSENNSTASSNSSETKGGKTTKPATDKVSNTPAPEVGVTYKVQILAAHRVVNKTYFRQNHQYAEDFNIENHDGWVKYTAGRFGDYREARDERERLRGEYGSLPGPFVTAYNNGERITVQEALLISKQQWMQ